MDGEPRATRLLDITAAGQSVRIDAERTGVASFDVTNHTPRPVRVRARVVAAAPLPSEWLTLLDPVERELESGEKDRYQVRVTIPPEGSAGRYSFRLDAAGIDDPEEVSVLGPSVDFAVASPKPSGSGSAGGHATVLGGAVAGGLLGLLLGALPFVFYLVAVVPRSGGAFDLTRSAQALEGEAAMLVSAVSLLLVGTAVGLYAGLLIGSWLAMRSRGLRARFLTLGLLAILAPVWSAMVWPFLVASTSGNEPSPALLVVIIGLGLTISVPALTARELALRLSRT
jgi:hypothetical protein